MNGANKYLEDIHILFENTHQLLNELRPHQARQKLINLLEEQIETGKREVDEVRRLARTVDVMTESANTHGTPNRLASGHIDPIDKNKISLQLDVQKERERKVWNAMLELEV